MKPAFLLSLLVLVLLELTQNTKPALSAPQAPTPVPVKIGYFDLERVKDASGGALDTDNLRIEAERELRRTLDLGQQTLNDARNLNESEEEQQELAEVIRKDLATKKEAFSRLVTLEKQLINAKVTEAASFVAKKKNLDLALDAKAVFAGGSQLLNNGEDITDDIISKFQADKEKREKSLETGQSAAEKKAESDESANE